MVVSYIKKYLKMKTSEKEDTVKQMREIREQLNKQFVDMDYQEEKRYIKKKLERLKKKKKSRSRDDIK